MGYQKITIKKDSLPSKIVDLEFNSFNKKKKKYYAPILIFARNGMGKTTIATELAEYAIDLEDDDLNEIERENSISVYGSDDLEYEVTNSDVIYVIKENSSNRFTNIGDQSIFVLNSDSARIINQIDGEINKRCEELKDKVERLLKHGGNRNDPDKMLVRLLYNNKILTDIGTFNKREAKLTYYKYSLSPIEVLEKINNIDWSSKTEETKDIQEKLHNAEEIAEFHTTLKLSSGFIEDMEGEKETNIKYKTILNELESIQKSSIEGLSGFIEKYRKLLSFLEELKEKSLNNISEEFSKEINPQLSQIFFDSNRLQIDESGKLLSRGESVKFSRLSAAEKNIITLIYSFYELKNKIDSTEDKKSVLLVLDDPISSTDYSNKVGLYGFFRKQIKELTGLYSEIRFVIFTHDEEVYYHFSKVFDDIVCYHKDGRTKDKDGRTKDKDGRTKDKDGKTKDKDGKTKEEPVLYRELTSYGLEERDYKDNFYEEQINWIFKYALNLAPELDSYIGNTMRRVLEAYATFNYSMGPSDISTNERILLEKIKNQTEREFFEAYMYRLILNSDSHASERVKRSSSNFTDMFDEEEKRKTAQLLLGFLYRIDPFHIERMLKSSVDSFESYVNGYNKKVKDYRKYENNINKIKENIRRINESNNTFEEQKKTIKEVIENNDLERKVDESQKLKAYIEKNKKEKLIKQKAIEFKDMIEYWLDLIK